ncbi:MAG: hypothetical protein QXJ17_00365 [Nitrososphaeria archaeon]
MERRKVIIIAIVVISFLILYQRLHYLNYLSETAHLTDKWVVIEDSKGNRIAVETTDDYVWDELDKLNRNKTKVFIGGEVVGFSNKWGFRFNPTTISIVRSVPKEYQVTIDEISSNLEYWKALDKVYVFAKVTEVHYLVAVES